MCQAASEVQLENTESLNITVEREGGGLAVRGEVRVRTEDGSSEVRNIGWGKDGLHVRSMDEVGYEVRYWTGIDIGQLTKAPATV